MSALLLTDPFVLAIIMICSVCIAFIIIYAVLAIVVSIELRHIAKRRASALNASDAIHEAETIVKAAQSKKVEE